MLCLTVTIHWWYWLWKGRKWIHFMKTCKQILQCPTWNYTVTKYAEYIHLYEKGNPICSEMRNTEIVYNMHNLISFHMCMYKILCQIVRIVVGQHCSKQNKYYSDVNSPLNTMSFKFKLNLHILCYRQWTIFSTLAVVPTECWIIVQ